MNNQDEGQTVERDDIVKVPPTASTNGFRLSRKIADIYETDSAKENDGAWMSVADGVDLKVRSQQSQQARTEATRLFKRRGGMSRPVSASEMDADNTELCATALVVDWRGFETDAGQTLACTDVNVRLVLTKLPELRRRLLAFSADMENFRP